LKIHVTSRHNVFWYFISNVNWPCRYSTIQNIVGKCPHKPPILAINAIFVTYWCSFFTMPWCKSNKKLGFNMTLLKPSFLFDLYNIFMYHCYTPTWYINMLKCVILVCLFNNCMNKQHYIFCIKFWIDHPNIMDWSYVMFSWFNWK